MSENTNTQDQNTNTQEAPEVQATEAADEQRKLYATREDAEKEKPAKAGKNAKVYTGTKGGTVVGDIWANGYGDCNTWTARTEGYSFSTGTTAPITREAVAAKLATFTDAELAAMGLSRSKKGKGK